MVVRRLIVKVRGVSVVLMFEMLVILLMLSLRLILIIFRSVVMILIRWFKGVNCLFVNLR